MILQDCAIPAVSALICFLAYSSQALFLYIEPNPLTSGQSIRFNVLVFAIFVCYYRACSTDPGRVPTGWKPAAVDHGDSLSADEQMQQRQRWCRRCNAAKPPRAHHCKTCKRCVLKMDHHCPWTANCVSHTTYPHFFRFLFYAVTAMAYLEYFLFIRVQVLWSKRNLPSYLGPSAFQLAHLFILVCANSIVLFALFILLVRTVWCLGANTTTIEGWEIERHATLVRRARYLGGFLDGPNGIKIRIAKQEFPYDIGIYANLAQGMGGHVHKWLWPFASTPTAESGLQFPENDIEEPGTSWPPPDPDRMFRFMRQPDPSTAFMQSMDPEDFRRRQEADLQRQRHSSSGLQRRQPFHLRYEDKDARNTNQAARDDYSDEDLDDVKQDELHKPIAMDEGEESWRNSEGERLADFGVDEDIEFYDEDDLPLSEIMRRRQMQNAT